MTDNSQSNALVSILTYLKKCDYQFTTITPHSHKIVVERDNRNQFQETPKEVLAALFGWSEWVDIAKIPSELYELLESANAVDTHMESGHAKAKSKWRVSTINESYYLHSAFPTTEKDSLFFGPDSYRYVNFLKQAVKEAKTIADIGSGTGVGAIELAKHLNKKSGTSPKILCLDINKTALTISKLNATFAGMEAETTESDLLNNLPQGVDTIISNPPFIIGDTGQTYSSGGNDYGLELSKKIVEQSLSYLNIGGVLALYTGSAIVNGTDLFKQWLHTLTKTESFDLSYEEIDPDIFGEKLLTAPYRDVDRIAAVGLTITKK